MVEISTSILSINKEDLIPVIYNLEIGKTNYFHIDVMDGKFVENNTNELMQKYCSSIKLISNIPLDIHLMVEDPLTYINAFIPFNPNIITIHYESFKDKKELINTINYIKNNNIRVGLAIKPNTSIEEIYEFTKLIHMILIMTVEPGKGGQKIIENTIEKVKNMKKYLKDKNIDIDIEVDGGINIENVNKLKDAGANIIVAGTSIVNSKNYEETINKLKE